MTWSRVQRVRRTHDEARAAYDRLARWFDLFEEPFERAVRRAGLRLLRPHPGEVVLEVGFGTGHDLVALAGAVGPAGHVLGLDISPEMRAVAERRVRRFGLADRVTLKTGDAVAAPFESASVDAVVMSFTLELFDTPEIPTVLSECRRVLRPAGRLAVIALTHRSPPTLATRLYEGFHERLPGLVDCRPIPVEAALVEAGFRVSQSVPATLWGLPVDMVVACV